MTCFEICYDYDARTPAFSAGCRCMRRRKQNPPALPMASFPVSPDLVSQELSAVQGTVTVSTLDFVLTHQPDSDLMDLGSTSTLSRQL